MCAVAPPPGRRYRCPMDVSTALTLVSAAAGGAATAAGQSAWSALTSLTRRFTGRSEEEFPAPSDGGEVRDFEARLSQLAEENAEFRSALLGWAEEHGPRLEADAGAVHNSVGEGATVNGPVVQARDISGGLHFG